MPILNMTMPLNVGTDRRLFRAAHNVTQSMKRVPVSFLNITTLSEYRKDAHTSVHTIRQGKLLDAEQQADPEHFADCIHWCLPGLPDTWNEFLYTKIISRLTWPRFLLTWSWKFSSFFLFIKNSEYLINGKLCRENDFVIKNFKCHGENRLMKGKKLRLLYRSMIHQGIMKSCTRNV